MTATLNQLFGAPPALVPLQTPKAKADTTQAELGKSVVDGVLVRTSVSGIALADPSQDGGCLRKFFIAKVLGLEPPKTVAQDEGTQGHAQLEHYLKTGEDVLGPLVRAGRQFIPSPDPRLLVESQFTAQGRELVAAGVPLVGFIDLINPTGFYLDETGDLRPEAPHTEEVLDWKTTKSIERYAKAGSALLRTVQMPGYAMVRFGKNPKLERVRLSHVYFQTGTKRAAKKSTAVVDRVTVERRWSNVESVVRAMKDAAKEKDPSKVEGNFSACDAFGGCPFRATAHCPRTTRDAVQAIFGRSTDMSLLDRMRGMTATTPAPAPIALVPPTLAPAPVPAPTPAKAPAPAPSPATAGRSLLSILKEQQAAEKARLIAEEEAARKATPAPVTPAPAPVLVQPLVPKPAAAISAKDARQNARYWFHFSTGPVLVQYVCLTKGGHSFLKLRPDGSNANDGVILLTPEDYVYPADSVLPPDAPASGTVALPAEPIPADAVVPPAVAAAAQEVAPLPEAAAVDAPTPKKRGRPRKNPEAVTTPETTTTPVATPETTTTPETPTFDKAVFATVFLDGLAVKKIEAVTPAPANAQVVLYIDAIPMKGVEVATNLEDAARTFTKALAEKYQAADVRCAPQDSPLGFGKWKGALAGLVRANVPMPGTYYILGTRQSEIAAVVAEAFAEAADVVVRGVN